MRLLFLSIGDIPSIRHHEIYPDLLREFIKKGHEVYVVCSRERRSGLSTELIEEDGARLLKVRIGNITKTNMIEKGVSTILVGLQYKKAINKYFLNTKFDLIMYSTPPITLVGLVKQLKKKNDAKTYLLLKDIFPQNAVDLGMMRTTGLKGLLYKHFRNQEKRLYRISDKIGCMSQANVDYVIKHNPEIDSKKVEICPNSVDVVDKSVDADTKISIRKKYSIPLDKRVFVYGGNLGKPQGISFLIECLKRCKTIENAFFLIIGDGTEYNLLKDYFDSSIPQNSKLMKRLPKEDYDTIVGSCDVGLIFLDYRFTIPNYPSRILSYMQARLPVLACTDPNTDIGQDIIQGNFGWWCESKDSDAFANIISEVLNYNLQEVGNNGYNYLQTYFSVEKGYDIIMRVV